eukprot:2704149-Lingulodinium_polyedra.AAC.1
MALRAAAALRRRRLSAAWGLFEPASGCRHELLRRPPGLTMTRTVRRRRLRQRALRLLQWLARPQTAGDPFDSGAAVPPPPGLRERQPSD